MNTYPVVWGVALLAIVFAHLAGVDFGILGWLKQNTDIDNPLLIAGIISFALIFSAGLWGLVSKAECPVRKVLRVFLGDKVKACAA
jgi:hypothetical protein